MGKNTNKKKSRAKKMFTSNMGCGFSIEARGNPGQLTVERADTGYRVLRWIRKEPSGAGSYDIVARVTDEWMAEAIVQAFDSLRKQKED